MADRFSAVLIRRVRPVREVSTITLAVMQQHGAADAVFPIALLVSGIQFISMALLGELVRRPSVLTANRQERTDLPHARSKIPHRKKLETPPEPARPSGTTEGKSSTVCFFLDRVSPLPPVNKPHRTCV